MAIRDLFNPQRKGLLNPFRWMDYEFIKIQHRTIRDVLQPLYSVDQPDREETFKQAMQRLDITEDDVKSLIRRYSVYTVIFLLLALILFNYSFYLLFRYTSWTGWLLGLGVTGLFCAQAFKYHFWLFQLRERRLGATVAEWKRSILGDKGKRS